VSIAATPALSELVRTNWEQEIGQLLEELSSAQHELLAILGEKRARLSGGDVPGNASIPERELALVGRLEACLQRRADLLQRAKDDELRLRTLLKNETLHDWGLAQRLLLEVSQLVEMIAAGGRIKPAGGDGMR
jgi:hypothetical protein